MKNAVQLLFPMALLLACSLNSCSFTCTPGEGEIIEERIDLDLFYNVDNSGSVNVEIAYGPNQEVVFIGHRNHLEVLNKEVGGETWEIEFDGNVCTDDIVLRIITPRMESISCSGSGNIKSTTPIQAEDIGVYLSGSGDIDLAISAESLEVELDGSGDITLRGNAESITCELDGSGEIDASEVMATEASVSASGSGNIDVYASEALDIELSGSGNVNYYGEPETVSFEKSGSGEVNEK